MAELPEPFKRALRDDMTVEGAKVVAARVGVDRTSLYEALADRAGASVVARIGRGFADRIGSE